MNSPKALPGGRLVALGAVAALLVVPILASAGQGDPDRSFGSGGVAMLPRNDTLLRGAAVQRDGKLVAVGELGAEAGSVRLLVARFNRNGSLDRSFAPSGGLPILGGGSGGIYLGPVGTTASAVAIQGGRILVAGARTDGSGSDARGMLLMRLKANGTPDRSFGGDGRAAALARRSGEANGIAVRGNRIVLAGAATLGSAQRDAFSRVAVARFRTNGAPDRSFGHRGAEVLDFGRLSVANAAAIRSGGGILLVGSVRNNLQSTELLAARLKPSGAPDRRFNADGVFIRQYGRGGAFSAANDLLPAGRGGLVAAGVASTSSHGPMAIAVRLSSRGGPVRGFSGDGVAYLRAARDSDQYDKIHFLAGAYGIVRDGARLVLGGAFDSLGLKRLAVWGLKANGRVARGFGKGGRTVTPGGQGSAELSDLVRARNGKLYGVGDTTNFVDPSTGLAARYQGD